MGRGGRVILDRMSTNMDDLWSNMDYKIFDSEKKISIEQEEENSVVSDKTTTTISEINRNNCEQRTNLTNNLNNKIISGNNVIINKVEDLETTTTTTVQSCVDNLIIKQEKLDDYYDKYLESITNVYNKPTTNQLNDLSNISISSGGSSFNQLPRILSSQDSGISISQKLEFSETIDNTTTTIKTEPLDTNSRDGTESIIDAGEIIIDDVKDDFLDDVRKNWLHFRPKTPTTTELADIFTFGDQTVNQLTETTPFTIEIQSLNNQLPSSVFTENSENLFLTNPFSLDDLIEDPIQIPSTIINENSLNDFNSSGDSLNELNLSIGDSQEDSEKMLDNILQECQIEDLKSFHTNTNFWNGILEDTLEDIIDDKKSVFDKLGYSSEFVNNFDDKRQQHQQQTTGINNNEKRGEKRKRNSQRCNQRTGSSMFNVSNSSKDDFFKKDDVKVNETVLSTPLKNNTQTVTGNSAVLSGITEQKVFIKTEQPENYSISNNYVLQSPLIMTQNPLLEKVSTENTIVLTSSPATTPIRRHVNGPTDKNSE